MTRHILVTGATGYIGRRLCELALEAGHRLTILARDPAAGPDHVRVRAFPFHLGEEPPKPAFDGIDAVIHLATGTNDPSAGEVDEVGAAKRLLQAAREAGVERFVFVSSIAAAADAPTAYGKTKHAVEKLLNGSGEVVVRPALAYGGELSGRNAFATLCRLVERTRVIPMVNPGRRVQPVHIDDLCAALISLTAEDAPRRSFFQLARPEPVSISEFLNDLARVRYGKRVLVVPIPVTVALMACEVLRFAPFLPTVPKDRIRGLTRDVCADPLDGWAVLGLTPRPLHEGLAAEAPHRRRRLLREARTLLAYVGGGAPAASLVARYVRAIERRAGGVPHDPPPATVACPSLLGFIEPLGKGTTPRQREFRRRLRWATSLAEATPQFAGRFLNRDRALGAAAILVLARIGLIEVLRLPFRLVASWLLR